MLELTKRQKIAKLYIELMKTIKDECHSHLDLYDINTEKRVGSIYTDTSVLIYYIVHDRYVEDFFYKCELYGRVTTYETSIIEILEQNIAYNNRNT